ncbi:MAG: flagellar export chaperone FliS [Candidatus Tectomicrobia bacterium]|uniref:Flagellar secretion chaperone FliS n=1 Tax=Tectimicrobiota bacterium TaxID=2528274 RepID=A0A932GNL2_UNCTE|nr:flagellar export chaperone FliS [Candidatus Tectomicrobia bacterium]
MSQNAIKAYEQTRVTTAGQGELILLLYDSAITALRQAAGEIRAKHYEAKGRLLSKAREIIEELWASLNPEAGPVAVSLDSLYSYMIRRILHANLNLDAKAAEEVARFLSELREAWAAVVNRPGVTTAAEEKVKVGRKRSERPAVANPGLGG